MRELIFQTVYRLNVNKTKFYKLAKDRYPEIGPMKAAEFVKYPRSRDYALDFTVGEYHHHLFLSVVGGKARWTSSGRSIWSRRSEHERRKWPQTNYRRSLREQNVLV